MTSRSTRSPGGHLQLMYISDNQAEGRELGFAKSDGDADGWRPGWHARPWRPVWTGYTPEQRRLIRDGFKPTAVSHKELV